MRFGTMSWGAMVGLVAFGCLASAPAGAQAADQTMLGAGNADAAALAASSPRVQSAKRRVEHLLSTVGDRNLREATQDALFNPQGCIHHRSGLTAAGKQAILAQLLAAGLYLPANAASFPGGALAGVFPPVRSEGPCPKLPQPFDTAPGSSFGGHHSFPGGLVVHEGFNIMSALGLADNYESAYGAPAPRRHGDLGISRDAIVAAPMWHDWAKTIVFQWNADGTEFAEFSFGGNGATDNFGKAGDSRTGGHHILGLAETIVRGLAPEFVIVQVSAHSAPTLGNEYKVVNWIRAAAIVAQVDPVSRGLLARDAAGNLRLPPRRNSGDIDLNAAGQVNLLVEDAIHNLSDADFNFSIPATTEAQVILQNLAPRYGYSTADQARYNTRFRNPVMSFLSAERILILYTNRGLQAVQDELDALRNRHVI